MRSRTAGTPAALAAPPPQRRTASRVVVESLRDQIASGELKRGERLPSETDLAAHFGVSHPPVREALRVLEVMGLVEVRHGSGAYVTGDPRQFIANSLHTLLQVDRVGILEVLEMRKALAAYSAVRVVDHAGDEDLDLIEDQGRRLAEAGESADFEHIADAAVAFQVSVSAATHNALLFAIDSVLAEVLVRLQVDAFAKRSRSFWKEWSLQFAADRAELMAAFRARDSERAVAAMNAYLERQQSRFSSDETLATARLSDPEIMRVLASKM
ncbi:FadR/GntR family transcriptional regulator [Kribbia dieselivorans]|uniref:FadR/GntR family transcriptional regulator n=1 Tax=Kribbia dieselivorans TaxID=331526 RepID=UPI0008396D5E|nr:GntR family transcriptional regulator [Kribbia dieselivorans]